MNLAQASGNAGLAAILALHNSGTLVAYNGTQPATPETALSGNTALVTCSYSVTAFGAQTVSGGFTQASASFSAASFAPSNSGGATFCRALKSDGTTVIADYTVGFAWLASTVVAVGQYCTNGGNTYKCSTAGTTAASGGPTGQTAGIVDGTAHWDYVGTPNNTWAASTVYAVGASVVNGGNYYVCTVAGTSAASGGPTGTGTDITDNTARWDFAGYVGLFDITMGNVNIATGTNVAPTQTLKLPVV